MFTDNSDPIGNQEFVDLLKFAPEQAVERVIELDLVAIPTRPSLSHARVRLRERP
jgi:hypothetical protein